MSTEANKALIRRFINEIMNTGNLAIVDELFAPNYIGHIAGAPEPVRGRETLKQQFAASFMAFPDWHVTVEDIIAEGGAVVDRWSIPATTEVSSLAFPQPASRSRIPGSISPGSRAARS